MIFVKGNFKELCVRRVALCVSVVDDKKSPRRRILYIYPIYNVKFELFTRR